MCCNYWRYRGRTGDDDDGSCSDFFYQTGRFNLGHPSADKCSCADTHLIVSGSVFTCVDIVDFFYDI
jgi:hypothetical protein